MICSCIYMTICNTDINTYKQHQLYHTTLPSFTHMYCYHIYIVLYTIITVNLHITLLQLVIACSIYDLASDIPNNNLPELLIFYKYIIFSRYTFSGDYILLTDYLSLCRCVLLDYEILK